MEEGKVSFYTGTSEQVLSSPINNGAFYLAKDTSKIYLDIDGKRYNLSAAEVDVPVNISQGGTGTTALVTAATSLRVPSLVGGVAIPANADFNDYTTCGTYHCSMNLTVKTLKNRPCDCTVSAEDHRLFWQNCGTGYAYYSELSCLQGQPC